MDGQGGRPNAADTPRRVVMFGTTLHEGNVGQERRGVGTTQSGAKGSARSSIAFPPRVLQADATRLSEEADYAGILLRTKVGVGARALSGNKGLPNSALLC